MAAHGAAMADWVKVGESPEAVSFVDPSAVIKKGNTRKVWVLQNLKKPLKGNEMSQRFLREFDCTGGQNRILSYQGYSEAMGNGKVVQSSDDASDWFGVPMAGPTIAAVFKLVCSA